MKNLFQYSGLLLVCLCLGLITLAQEVVKGMQQDMKVKFDDKGNAHISVSMELNASQWDMFKRNVGGNTAYLKRQMEKGLPKFFLDDFKYSEESMDRKYTLEFEAYGVVSQDRHGKWRAELDAEDPDINKISDQEFELEVNYATNGALIEQRQRIFLPANATDSKIEKDSFGKAILTYKIGDSSMDRILFFLGLALIAGGGLLMYFNFRPPSGKTLTKPSKKDQYKEQLRRVS